MNNSACSIVKFRHHCRIFIEEVWVDVAVPRRGHSPCQSDCHFLPSKNHVLLSQPPSICALPKNVLRSTLPNLT